MKISGDNKQMKINKNMDGEKMSSKSKLIFSLLFMSVVLLTFSDSYGQHVEFIQHMIFSDFDSPFDCYTADIDDDGDQDITACSVEDNKLGWWENDGTGNFTTHIISHLYLGPITVYADDLDNDSDMDILCGYFHDGFLGWWENDGNENFSCNMISFGTPSIRCVHSADIDEDGDKDVIIAVESLDLITCFENDGNQNFIQHDISSAFNDPRFVTTADMDDDGDLDILSAYYDGQKIVCWENDGLFNFTVHIICESFGGPWVVRAVDLDEDGDQDILSSARSSDMIAWWQNHSNWNFEQHIIGQSSRINGSHDVCAGDLDIDGDLDIVGIACYNDRIGWGRNNGNQVFQGFGITAEFDYPNRIQVADFDEDGDLDFTAVSYYGNSLEWWENTLIDSPGDILCAGSSGELLFQPGILQASPNPFNPTTTITFDLPQAGLVSLSVYDITGRQVAKLVDGMKPIGQHQIVFDASNLSSGVYFAVLNAGNFKDTRKLLLVK